MSADNGYILRNNKEGKFVLQMYFASDEEYPDVEKADPRQIFDTLEAAILDYNSQEGEDGYYSEYGLSISLDQKYKVINCDGTGTLTAVETPLPKPFYDVLYETIQNCPNCGKREYTIETSSMYGRKTHYSLVTCVLPGCRDHCRCWGYRLNQHHQ